VDNISKFSFGHLKALHTEITLNFNSIGGAASTKPSEMN